jgi:hypothetical protein
MTKLTRTNFSIKELTDMYANGEIAIPEIQRDFVWDSKRIKLLLDSIYMDYPSGAIILWRPRFHTRSEFEMLIRPERLHLYKNCLPTYLLLDGQQRLTALCSIILPANQVIESIGEEIDLPRLFINLKTLKIEASKDSITASNNEVLLNRLLSSETDDSGLSSILNDLTTRKDITPKHKNRLKDFRERILQYSYPVQILENHDYETVANIFKRVNSQGKILVTAELELATIVPHWKGISKHLRSFIKEMRSDGLNVDLPFFMKCLAFIATDWPAIDYFSKSVVKGEFTRGQLENHWRITKWAIRKLSSILKRNGIDRTELITTRNALVPIVYSIAKDKKSRISNGQYIKWLIYTMDGGHYTQKTESVLRKDSYPLTDSLPRIEKGFLKMYKHMVRQDLYSTVFRESDFRGPAPKNPAMMFIYLALRHKKARDFTGKKAPTIDQIHKYQIHHIFPIEFMLNDEQAEKYRKKNNLSRAEFRLEVNDVANLTFISTQANQEIKKRPPFDYLAKLSTPKNLEAHCIPKDHNLWKPERFKDFCNERRRLLSKAINSYIRNLE